MRWLAGNGADTALAGRAEGRSESGVCPHPSPTALQDAGAGSGAQGALKCRWFLSLRGGEGKGEGAHVNPSAHPNPSARLRTSERGEAATRQKYLAGSKPRWQGAGLRLNPHAVKIGTGARRSQVHEGGRARLTGQAVGNGGK